MWRILLCSLALSAASAQTTTETPVAPGLSSSAHRLPLWKTSVAALAVSSAIDAHSSWGKCCEANPLLPARDGRFGAGAAAVKAGAFGGQVLFQVWAVRRWPRAARPLAIVNFAASGLLTGVALRNYRIPRTPVGR